MLFLVYALLAERRSLKAVYEACGRLGVKVSERTIENYSARYGWQERVVAFDRDAREREQRDKLDHQVPEAEGRPSGGPASLGEVLRDIIGVRTGAGVLPLPP